MRTVREAWCLTRRVGGAVLTAVFPAALAGMAVVAVWGAAAPAGAFVLVTPQEFARDQAAARERPMRGDAKGDIGAPNIVLLKPASLSGLRSPTDIALRFAAKAPARIVPSSLRVLYGFFGIDVTKRLLANAKVSETGISATGASLPEGSHRITIEIADSKRRVGRKTFRFEIQASDMK